MSFLFYEPKKEPTLIKTKRVEPTTHKKGVVSAISYEFLSRTQYHNRQNQSRWKGKTQTPGWNVKFDSLLQANCTLCHSTWKYLTLDGTEFPLYHWGEFSHHYSTSSYTFRNRRRRRRRKCWKNFTFKHILFLLVNILYPYNRFTTLTKCNSCRRWCKWSR